MITFPVTAETFIADQEKRAGRKFDDFQRELLGEYAELFNLEFDVGMKGEEPSNVLKDTAEFYARKGKGAASQILNRLFSEPTKGKGRRRA